MSPPRLMDLFSNSGKVQVISDTYLIHHRGQVQIARSLSDKYLPR